MMQTANRIHFGTSKYVDGNKGVNKEVLELLNSPDELSNDPQNLRNIILASHGLRQDLLILRCRGFMFEKISTIVAKYDTLFLAKDVLGMGSRL